MSMTFVCLGIAKLECQISLGISFSLSNKPMYDILKRKICKEKSKAKRLKNAFKNNCKRVFQEMWELYGVP